MVLLMPPDWLKVPEPLRPMVSVLAVSVLVKRLRVSEAAGLAAVRSRVRAARVMGAAV